MIYIKDKYDICNSELRCNSSEDQEVLELFSSRCIGNFSFLGEQSSLFDSEIPYVNIRREYGNYFVDFGYRDNPFAIYKDVEGGEIDRVGDILDFFVDRFLIPQLSKKQLENETYQAYQSRNESVTLDIIDHIPEKYFRRAEYFHKDSKSMLPFHIKDFNEKMYFGVDVDKFVEELRFESKESVKQPKRNKNRIDYVYGVKNILFINTPAFNRLFKCELNIPTGFYPIELMERPLEAIRRICGKEVVLPSAKSFPKHQHIGVDCEFVSSNSNLLSFQYYSVDTGLGLITFHKGIKPGFKDVLNYLQRNFYFKKLDFISHYNCAELSHYDDVTKDLKNFYNNIIKKVAKKRKRNKDGSLRVYKSEKNYFYTSSNCLVSTRHMKVNSKHYLLDEDGETVLRDEKCSYSFALRDTYLLNNKESLSNLGSSLGFDKDDLDISEITNMDDLLMNNPFKYCKYAMKDAMICALSCVVTDDYILDNDLCGDKKNTIIPSASALAGKYIEAVLNSIGLTRLGIKDYARKHQGWTKDFNYDNIPGIISNGGWGLPKIIADGKDAYYGGRNECFIHGQYNSLISDYDLKSAYPTAILALYTPNWKNPKYLKDIEDVNSLPINSIGYIELDFEFKRDIKYPYFPIKTGSSLIFPRTGSTVIDLISFRTAVENKALENYYIKKLVYFPPLNTSNYMAEAMKKILMAREDAKNAGDKLLEKVYKNISNYIYGKMCQGIGETKRFDYETYLKTGNRGQHSAVVGYSKVYNPVYAASITGMVRSCITETMEQIDKMGIKIASVTTDGFVTLGSPNDHPGLISPELTPLNNFIMSAKNKMFPNEDLKSLYTLKHFNEEGEEYYSLATRFYWMVSKRDEDTVQIAKGGIQVPYKDKPNATHFLKSCYLSPDDSVEINRLISLQKMVMSPDEIFRSIKTKISKNYDYDRKRLPIRPEKNLIENNGKEVEKVRFDTKPFENIEQYYRYKEVYKRFKEKIKRNKLQTINEITNINILAYDVQDVVSFNDNRKFTDLFTMVKLKMLYSYVKTDEDISKAEIAQIFNEKDVSGKKHYKYRKSYKRFKMFGKRIRYDDYVFLLRTFEDIRELHENALSHCLDDPLQEKTVSLLTGFIDFDPNDKEKYDNLVNREYLYLDGGSYWEEGYRLFTEYGKYII